MLLVATIWQFSNSAISLICNWMTWKLETTQIYKHHARCWISPFQVITRVVPIGFCPHDILTKCRFSPKGLPKNEHICRQHVWNPKLGFSRCNPRTQSLHSLRHVQGGVHGVLMLTKNTPNCQRKRYSGLSSQKIKWVFGLWSYLEVQSSLPGDACETAMHLYQREVLQRLLPPEARLETWFYKKLRGPHPGSAVDFFRNPARLTSWGNGSLAHYLRGFILARWLALGFSSTVWKIVCALKLWVGGNSFDFRIIWTFCQKMSDQFFSRE